MDGHLSVPFPANAQRSTGARRVASNAKRLAPTLKLFLCDAAQELRDAMPSHRLRWNRRNIAPMAPLHCPALSKFVSLPHCASLRLSVQRAEIGRNRCGFRIGMIASVHNSFLLEDSVDNSRGGRDSRDHPINIRQRGVTSRAPHLLGGDARVRRTSFPVRYQNNGAPTARRPPGLTPTR